MTTTIDIADLARDVGRLHEHGKLQKTLLVVVPLLEGRADVVREFLGEGPPFDLERAGLERHEVFLTPTEAIFLFESEHGVRGLEQALADPEVWQVVQAWEHCIAGPPRVAEAAYLWAAH